MGSEDVGERTKAYLELIEASYGQDIAACAGQLAQEQAPGDDYCSFVRATLKRYSLENPDAFEVIATTAAFM